jgi:glycerophosphoryl diester phosphodiesterase
VIVYAHRGASKELPENTMRAFERAASLGVDAIETDVHLSRDGVVVVHHDDDGARMASIGRRVADQSFEELSRWDVGFGFRATDGEFLRERFRIPRLSDVLEAFPSMRFNLDLKRHDRRMAEEAVGLVRRHGAEGRVLLTSFDESTVRAVRALGYRGMTGLAQREVLRVLALPSATPKWLRPGGDRVQIPVGVGRLRLATRGVIARLQRLGYAVDFWVVDEPSEVRRLEALGADGVMTDHPAGLAEAGLLDGRMRGRSQLA